MTRNTLRFAAILPAAVMITACGASVTSGGGAGAGSANDATPTYRQLNSLAPEKQRAEVVRRAKEEGELNLYTSLTSDVIDAVKEKFSEQYGITVNVFRGNSETVLQRVSQESRAGRLGADAVETNFAEMAEMSKAGMLGDYRGARLKQVGETGRFEHWTATRYNVFLPAWNTNLIKPGQEPRSWEDFADPRFDGKMTMELSDSDWFANVSVHWKRQGKTQSEIDALWREIADGATVTKGHTTMIGLLGAGQTGVDAMNYSYITARAAEGGAPVDYRSQDGKAHVPGFPRPNGVGIFEAAEHPAAAWLFYDWMLSEGQQLLVDLKLTPSTKVPGDATLDGVRLEPYVVDEMVNNGAKWEKAYDALLRGVPKAPTG